VLLSVSTCDAAASDAGAQSYRAGTDLANAERDYDAPDDAVEEDYRSFRGGADGAGAKKVGSGR